jgi:hypothetical protein
MPIAMNVKPMKSSRSLEAKAGKKPGSKRKFI